MARFTIAAAVAAASLSTAAVPAATGGFAEAVIEWRHAPQQTVIVDEQLWQCAGTICRGRVVEHRRTIQRTCRILARSGRLISFLSASGQLGPEQLQRCNGGK